MTKLLKISARAIGVLLEWALILLIIFAFGIRSGYIQTKLAQRAANYLSKELQAEIKIDNLKIVFIDQVAIDGLLIKDQNKDTLLFAKRLFLTLDKLDIANKKYVIGEAKLQNGFGHIKRYKDSTFNHSFIREYFIKKPSKKKNDINFQLKKVVLADTRFKYDDYLKENRSYGVDYWHISATEINGIVENIEVKKDVITGQITHFSAHEKSGINITDLQTSASVSPRGILLSSTTINTDKSEINASKFNMLSQNYTNFKFFVDSVRLEAEIEESTVALDEAAKFGYVLEGMKDEIKVSTKLNNKISNLQIKDFNIAYKDNTKLEGTLNLADYRDFKNGLLHDIIKYAYIDLHEINTLKFPNSSGIDYLNLNPDVLKFDHIEVFDLRLDGVPDEFVVESDRIKTALGSVVIQRGLRFAKNDSNNSYIFSKALGDQNDIIVEDLELNKLINDNDFGVLNGEFSFNGEYFSSGAIKFYDITGDVNQFQYLGYNYNNISIEDGSYQDKIFEGKVDIQDDNLDLVYDGFIDFNDKQKMVFSVDLASAVLDKIGISKVDSRLRSKIQFNLTGKTTENIEGRISITSMAYTRNGKEIQVPNLDLIITRSTSFDQFIIESSALDAKIIGKLNANNFYNDLMYQLGHVFPALIKINELKEPTDQLAHFTYDINVKKADEIIGLFSNYIYIAPQTKLNGHYFGEDSEFATNFSSDSIHINEMKIQGVKLTQLLDSNSVNNTIHANNFAYNDSIQFKDVYLKTVGGKDELGNTISWEGNTQTPSLISWNTSVFDWNYYSFSLEPSYFYIKGHKWDIEHKSNVTILGDTIQVDDFDLSRNDQSISIDGLISKDPNHKLNYRIDDLEVSEFSEFITSEYPMKGKLNAWGNIATPFTHFMYSGDASLLNFNVNQRDVGNIFFQSDFDNEKSILNARGDLIYKNNETFNFYGGYDTKKKENNLDFTLDFDYTDIQFVNAFMDPDVLKDIRGILDGQVLLTGSPSEPELDGAINLYGGSAFVDILGVHFGVEGPIEVDKYGFYMNNIPVYDEDGNAGSLIGAVFHDDFTDFNFDLQFDIENDAIHLDPFNSWKHIPLKEFLVMNLPYTPENLYYGTGYVTGTANIFGYTDNLEVSVDLKTQKGTTFNLPMYGVGEIEDEINFVTFKDELSDTIEIKKDPKLDFTGVTLDLNFDVTSDAEAKIIFNEELGDIITAKGTGQINLKLDNLGDIRMAGTYTVTDGVYDFAMGLVKQKFFIQEGGTISWSGDPYNADLNLKTYYKVNANIADLSQDQLGSGSGAHQPVYCYLNLDESLLKPAISFDIKAPQANDIARSLVNRVANDPDELNRQFFSLLLWKRFQPLAVGTNVSGSAAADLITNQINSMLSVVSSDYKLNVNYNNDQLTGDSQYEFGISKGFLDDRLILSGSFGVENTDNSEGDVHSNLIGDLNLEYLLNESGTFRVNIFNQSTDKTIIQENNLGNFTQGAGLSYKEDFNDVNDFKLIQSFLDLFRSKENKRFIKKQNKQKRRVPLGDLPPSEGVKEDN